MTMVGDSAGPQPGVTARQRQILTVIGDWVQGHGYPPTVREIAAAVGLASPSSVAYHIGVLEQLGLLRRSRRGPRTVDIRPLGAAEGERQVRVALLGTIAAGSPILADQHVDEQLTLPLSLVGHGELFALRVRGDSMVDAAICDGDVVVVRQQPVADNGDVVAAMLDGDATVKVYRRNRDGHTELVPRNPAYEPIPADDAVVLGKVVCVLRRL
jgi:repressor LexA